VVVELIVLFLYMMKWWSDEDVCGGGCLYWLCVCWR